VARHALAACLWIWIAAATAAYLIQFRELLAALIQLYR
jgi:hypothetical protein